MFWCKNPDKRKGVCHHIVPAVLQVRQMIRNTQYDSHGKSQACRLYAAWQHGYPTPKAQ